MFSPNSLLFLSKSPFSPLILSFFLARSLLKPPFLESKKSLILCAFRGANHREVLDFRAQEGSSIFLYFLPITAQVHSEDNTRNQVVSQEARGFESHPVRQKENPAKWRGFPFGIPGGDSNGSGVRKRAGGTFSPRPGLRRSGGRIPPCRKKQPLRSQFRSGIIAFWGVPGTHLPDKSFSQRGIVQFEAYKASSLEIPAELFYNLRRCANTQNGGMRNMNKAEERKTTLNVSISAVDNKF